MNQNIGINETRLSRFICQQNPINFFLHIYDILEFGVSQSGLNFSDWLIDCLMFLPYRQYSSHVTAVALVSQMTNDSNIIVRFECMFVFHLFSLVCDCN